MDCTCHCHNNHGNTTEAQCKCIPMCEHCRPELFTECRDADCPLYVIGSFHKRGAASLCKYP